MLLHKPILNQIVYKHNRTNIMVTILAWNTNNNLEVIRWRLRGRQNELEKIVIHASKTYAQFYL